MLLNSHLLSEVELVCDRVAILSRGRVTAAGRPDELTKAGGIEVETGDGVRRVPGRAAGGCASDRARRSWSRAPRYEVRILRSTLEDVYLEAVASDV